MSAIEDRRQKILSRLFYKMFQSASKFKMTLAHETVRLVSRRALNSVLVSKEKVRYHQLLFNLSGFPVAHISYTPIKEEGVNDESFKEGFERAVDIFVNYSNLGLYLSLWFSFVFFFISVLGGCYALISYFYLDSIV